MKRNPIRIFFLSFFSSWWLTAWCLFLSCAYDKSDAPVHYIGRFDLSKPGIAVFEWPGVCIEAVFEGTVCNFTLIHHPYMDAIQFSSNYYNLIIDDRAPVVFKVASDTTITTTHAPGTHTIKLIKRTEAFCGRDEFLGFRLEEDKRMLPMESKSRRIEFIGNSIICGWGNEGKIGEEFTGATENCYMSFASITARNLDAECFLTSFSGKGLWVNGDNSVANTVPLIYDKIFPMDTNSPRWDFSSWIPHAVVINLGANDYGCSKPPDSMTFINAYADFIKRIRRIYTGASIFCVSGPLGVYDNSKMTLKEHSRRETNLSRYVRQAVKHAASDGITNLYPFVLSPTIIPDGMGANKHPNIYQHTINATELTQFMKEKMNW